MADIDVLASIDAESIIHVYGKNTDPNNPVSVDDKYIHMVVRDTNAFSGQGGGELEIAASVEDQIRWRATSLSLQSKYDVLLYAFEATRGKGLISKPAPMKARVTSLLPNPDAPTNPTTQTIQDYYWSCNVEDQGEVTYHFNFMIYERSHGELKRVGCYSWDPFIKISD